LLLYLFFFTYYFYTPLTNQFLVHENGKQLQVITIKITKSKETNPSTDLICLAQQVQPLPPLATALNHNIIARYSAIGLGCYYDALHLFTFHCISFILYSLISTVSCLHYYRYKFKKNRKELFENFFSVPVSKKVNIQRIAHR